MSDQREIRIDLERLREFLLVNDRETRISALRAIDGIFESDLHNAPEFQAKIIAFLKSDLRRAEEALIDSSPEEQLLFVSALTRMANIAGNDCPEMGIAVIEAAIDTRSIRLREDSQGLLKKYIDLGGSRKEIMRALISKAALSLSWENSEFFGVLATWALKHDDSRESGLILLANIASHPGIKLDEREAAMITINMRLRKGMEVGCIENEIRGMAKKRNDPLFENARALLAAAELRGFNRAGDKGVFRKIETGLTPIFASPPLRLKRTGTSA